MDIYTKLSTSMDRLEALFESRMTQYESELNSATMGDSQSVHKSIASLSRDFMEFRQVIWQTVSTLKTQMELVILGLDRLEMASRNKVLLLHGLPESEGADVHLQVMDTLTKKMQLQYVSGEDISKCHRLGVASSRTRPILIRFKSIGVRNMVWKEKSSLRGSKITLSEFLTKSRHEVFMQARKHFGIRCCWTSEGRITILLPNKSRSKIESNSELKSLISQFPTPVVDNEHGAESSGACSKIESLKKTGVAAKRQVKPVK